jgi:hypothetical protein
MKKIQLLILSNLNLILVPTLILLTISNITFGQTSIDFSGVWILNTTKSSPIYSNLSAAVIITQDNDANTLNFNIKSESPEIELAKLPSRLILNGKKILVDCSKKRSTQISAGWSSDRKKVIVSECSIVYSLENNYILIITIDGSFREGVKTNEVERSIMVFNRAVNTSFPKKLPLIIH